ncbi:MAG: hypothetical protein AAFR35_01240 [Pseudomonadota bacterium]
MGRRWSPYWTLGAAVLFIGFHIASTPMMGELNALLGPERILDARFPRIDRLLPWTPADADATLSTLGTSGRTLYRHYLAVYDMPFAIAIMPLFFFAMLQSAGYRRAAFLAGVPATADVLENLSILALLVDYPDGPVVAAAAGPYMTLAKWLGVVLVIAICAAGATRALRSEAA